MNNYEELVNFILETLEDKNVINDFGVWFDKDDKTHEGVTIVLNNQKVLTFESTKNHLSWHLIEED